MEQLEQQIIEIPDNSKLAELFRQNHPVLYKFLIRLNKADPNCQYLKLSRGQE
jgi:hypothetical protein